MPNTLYIIICFPELRLSSINKTNKNASHLFAEGTIMIPEVVVGHLDVIKKCVPVAQGSAAKVADKLFLLKLN
jgi:hypothetical protein